MNITTGNFTNDLASSSSMFMGSMSSIFTLVLGIALAMWVIGFIVDRLRGGDDSETMD